MAKAFHGKTLSAKRPTRGGDDASEQSEAFIQLYGQFFDVLGQLEDSEKQDFMTRANGLLAEKDLGTVLGSGEEDAVKDLFSELEVEDLTSVMTFLQEEEVVSFD